ncbi:MAG: DUF2071 domain-containing protein [Phycisphaeraceae bacterium]|nr:MAG: DUF2071 domain-containing protein [Phycisphaeraceae bacterium]
MNRPRGMPVMKMRWESLLFAHWRIDASLLRPLVPEALDIETYDGSAWIGVIPFTMSGVRASFLPPIPGTHSFHELNVRTYVRPPGAPEHDAGVWFFSLDAASRLAVRGARLTFGLPYYDAGMRLDRRENEVRYTSRRTHRGAVDAEFEAVWTEGNPLPRTSPGSLEHFLTERYCLYALRRGMLCRGRIVHEPWPLRSAEVSMWRSTMVKAIGVAEPDEFAQAHLLCADALRVEAMAPKRVKRS